MQKERMSDMSRVNKTQKYAALWLNSQGWSVSKISNELSLTDTQVSNVIKTSAPDEDSSKIKTVSAPVKQPSSKNLMITESAGKTRNVSIMTKEASQLNDEFKKASHNIPKREKGIFRPNQQ